MAENVVYRAFSLWYAFLTAGKQSGWETPEGEGKDG